MMNYGCMGMVSKLTYNQPNRNFLVGHEDRKNFAKFDQMKALLASLLDFNGVAYHEILLPGRTSKRVLRDLHVAIKKKQSSS